MLPNPLSTVLCRDPTTTYRLNCNAFQQSGITSEFGWQYTVFYTSDTPEAGAPRHVSMARRRLLSCDVIGNRSGNDGDKDNDWQRIVLRDYAQVTEDGHNTISMGISKGDGRIHLVWDLHCDQMRYRRSKSGLAWSSDDGTWSANSFGEIESGLPGAEDAFREKEITYPRFLSVDKGEMLFECRVGRAGSGDTALCRYKKSDVDEWRWDWLGVYLQGKDCSPYVNGLDFDEKRKRLWVTWTNRRFIEQQRECDMSQHSQQAGPNGPENNENLGCLYSDDGGKNWQASDGTVLPATGGGSMSVDSRDDRAIVRRIPRNSGIMNQEAQCIDGKGDVHVLMRDNSTTGKNQWKHHWRSAESAQWSTQEIAGLQPTGTGSRGKICCDRNTGDIYFVIPGNTDTSLTLLRRRYHLPSGDLDRTELRNEYGPIETMWQQQGFDGEPLIDVQRLQTVDGRLSVMTRSAADVIIKGPEVLVLDWDITGSS